MTRTGVRLDRPPTDGVAAEAGTREFGDFYRSSRDGVYRALALTLRDRDLAADAVDEAMARAVERWDRVGVYDKPEGWVYRVGLNWATSRLRRQRREVKGAFLEPAAPDQLVPDPEISRSLTRLSVDHRAVIVLRFYADWSIDEIAAALAISSGTVKSRLSRALDRMRTMLEQAR